MKSLQTRDEAAQLEFRREAEMLGKTSHPNLARLLAMCREAEPHYLVLEYADMVSNNTRVSQAHTSLIHASLMYCVLFSTHTHHVTHTSHMQMTAVVSVTPYTSTPPVGHV